MRRRLPLFSLLLLFLFGCVSNSVVIHDLDEREANEIVVFLASKGILADKLPSSVSAAAATVSPSVSAHWNISVPPDRAIEAMSILNQFGLPRKKTPTILDLFPATSFMTSATEEAIRFQAGLASQIANTIRKIDGVIDAEIELSIPSEIKSAAAAAAVTSAIAPPPSKITASVYVKHTGILDNPNSHLVTKIKRLISSAVPGLDINDVTVIPDRARLTTEVASIVPEVVTPKPKEYVSIWSIVMSVTSAGKFRALFIFLLLCLIVLTLLAGWLVWKFYPLLRQHGVRAFFRTRPFDRGEEQSKEESSS